MSEANNSSDSEDITRLDFVQRRADQFQTVADDARSWLKTNFIIIGFFLPIIGSLFSDQLPVERVFNNAYTQVGIVVWLLSTLLFSIIYHRARVVAKIHFDPVEEEIVGDIPQDERQYRIQDTIGKYSTSIDRFNRLLSVCTLLTLTATTLFVFGLLLPYVDIIPQTNILVVVGTILLVIAIAAMGYNLRGHLPNIRQQLDWDTNDYDELTKPRQDLLKKIYVAVGKESFQLSDLPIKYDGQERMGTIPLSAIDESHVLLQDVSGYKISEYLLEQMVEEGYFEKRGETGTTTIRPPHTYEQFTVDEVGSEVERALDKLGQELDSNAEAREAAADELSLRPSEVLDRLRAGDELERIKRYNRIIRRLQNDDFDLASSRFDFTSDEVTYVPTELAEQAYTKIEKEEQRRKYEREMAEEQEKIRKAENTINFEVVEPVDEHGEIQVFVDDFFAQESGHRWFNIDHADISEEERTVLKNLDKGDEIRLRIEHHPRDDERYIASVGGP